MSANYNFPVWETQGGGLVRQEGEHYIFVEAPEGFPEIQAGDRMHEMWDLIPANESAREIEDEQDMCAAMISAGIRTGDPSWDAYLG